MAVALPDRPPLASSAATELYGRMEPYAHADPATGWPLAWLCEAIGSQFEDVDDVAIQGWAYLTNPDECPAWWLPHLAMWAGVQLDTGLPEADQRYQIRAMIGLRRGTPAAMVAAAVPYLTGERRVRMTERNGGNAYEVLVETYTSETPDSAAVERALLSQKPAGVRLVYQVIDGWTYGDLAAAYEAQDYADLAAAFTDYEELRTVIP